MNLDLPFEEQAVVGFDVETTGFKPNRGCRVIELAATRKEPDQELKFMSRLIDPGIPLPDVIVRVTGIDDAMIAKDAVPVKQALEEFIEFIKGSILVAQNAPFDVGFLSNEFHRAGFDLPDNPVLDTLKMARALVPGLMNYKLATLHQHLKGAADRSGAHRAGYDAQMCLEVCNELVGRSPAGPRQPAARVISWGGSDDQFSENQVSKHFPTTDERIIQAIRERKRIQVALRGYPFPEPGDETVGIVGVPVSVMYVDKAAWLGVDSQDWGFRGVKVSEIQELRFLA